MTKGADPVYHVSARIDARTFREFAFYDTFTLGGRWRLPVIFAGIMVTFAAAAALLNNGVNQALLISGVLLAIGLGLPAVYLALYTWSVYHVSRSFSGTAPAYEVELNDAGIVVTQGPHTVRVGWVSLFKTVRLKRLIALYAVRQKAYLIPRIAAGDDFDEIWDFIEMHKNKAQI